MASTGQGVAAAAVDHVRLSYHYADRGDVDGYASLLDHRAVLDRPGHDRVLERGAVAELRCARRHGGHDLLAVFAAGERIVAVGRFCGSGRVNLDFADIFSLSEHGLLVEQRCHLLAR